MWHKKTLDSFSVTSVQKEGEPPECCQFHNHCLCPFPSKFASFHSWLWTKYLAGVLGLVESPQNVVSSITIATIYPQIFFFMAMSQAPCWCCGGCWPSPRGRVRTRTSGSPGGRASLRILFRVRILSRSECYQDQNVIKIRILSGSTYYLRRASMRIRTNVFLPWGTFLVAFGTFH